MQAPGPALPGLLCPPGPGPNWTGAHSLSIDTLICRQSVAAAIIEEAEADTAGHEATTV